MPFQLVAAKPSYQDPDFKPSDESIGQLEFKGVVYEGRDVARVVDWRRLKDLPVFQRATEGKSIVRLFDDGVRASDINQGSVGNCWLLSSLACLATRPGAVEKLFLTPEYNEDGKYQLRLWDKSNRQYKQVTVDDNIPVWRQGGSPCFARPSGNEAWVLLLEKAMAKYLGSYHMLAGGMASWALETLTGHYTCVFLLERRFGHNSNAGPDPSSWRWLRAELATKVADRVVAFGAKPSPLTRANMYVLDQDDPARFYSHEEVFMAIVYHLAIGNLVAAATVGTDDDEDVNGVVRAHAYTVMQATPVNSNGRGQVLLLQVRNPHGAGGLEWNGDWSDRSTLWAKHPEVAAAVAYTPPASVVGGGPSTDGYFWMEFKDFIQHFKEVTFCCANGFDYVEEEQAGWSEVFNDASFPHDHRSLGDYKFIYNGNPLVGSQLDEVIKWLRLKEIAAPEQFRRGTRGLRLFAGGGTHPDDIDGSSSGLMVALACVANKPGAIEEMFLSGKEYRPDGAYQVKLFEPKSGAASIKPFDDAIPCFNVNPITKTKILGNEVWVLLLEKAVARLVDSYSKVSMWGVQVCWALACLTGEYTCLFMWEEGRKKWRRLELVFQEKQPASYRAEYASDDKSLFDSDDVFRTLASQLALGCLMAAETDRNDVASEATGLAKARNYSLLDARHLMMDGTPVPSTSSGPPPAGSVRLLKLRDPARQNEWKGEWSDISDAWERNPAVASALEYRREADGGGGDRGWGSPDATSSGRRDGSFWMRWEDVMTYFRQITVCGNSLRNNPKPWMVRQEDVDAARRRLKEARRQQQLRAEQEALEDSLHQELRRRAVDRNAGPGGPVASHVFAQAAMQASANMPKRLRSAGPVRPGAAAAANAALAGAAADGGAAAAVNGFPAPAAAGPVAPAPAAPAPAPAPPAVAAAGTSPPPPGDAPQGNGAAAGAAGAAAAGGGAAAAGAAASKPPVVVVDYKGCKACSIM